MRNQSQHFFFIIPAVIDLNCSVDMAVLGKDIATDCVLNHSIGVAPKDLYELDLVRTTDEFHPFTKK